MLATDLTLHFEANYVVGRIVESKKFRDGLGRIWRLFYFFEFKAFAPEWWVNYSACILKAIEVPLMLSGLTIS